MRENFIDFKVYNRKGEIFKMHKDTTLRKKIEKKTLMLKRRNKTIEIKAEINYTKQVTGKKSTISKVGSIKRLMKS